jgi:hypothetical protein
MFKLQLKSALQVLLLSVSVKAGPSNSPRCKTVCANIMFLCFGGSHLQVPSNSSWPPASAWSALNSSVSGRLIQAIPPGAACYSNRPEYNESDCAVLLQDWTSSSFHASNPISIDYPIWANNSCNPIFPNGTSVTGDASAGARDCTIGDYPVYVVNVSDSADVVAAFEFAQKWHVRLNIKNTGHNYPGRSTAFGSLS